jgi:hypothetical protein
MPSQGPVGGGTGVDDASFGDIAWGSTSSVTAEDGVGANLVLSNIQNGHYLVVTSFGFSIPGGSSVLGILFEIKKASTGFFSDARVRAVKGGVIGSTDRSAGGTWPGSYTFVSHGGASDLWGDSWSAADINASGFGVAIACVSSASGSGGVDFVRATVTFASPFDGLPIPNVFKRQILVRQRKARPMPTIVCRKRQPIFYAVGPVPIIIIVRPRRVLPPPNVTKRRRVTQFGTSIIRPQFVQRRRRVIAPVIQARTRRNAIVMPAPSPVTISRRRRVHVKASPPVMRRKLSFQPPTITNVTTIPIVHRRRRVVAVQVQHRTRRLSVQPTQPPNVMISRRRRIHVKASPPIMRQRKTLAVAPTPVVVHRRRRVVAAIVQHRTRRTSVQPLQQVAVVFRRRKLHLKASAPPARRSAKVIPSGASPPSINIRRRRAIALVLQVRKRRTVPVPVLAGPPPILVSRRRRVVVPKVIFKPKDHPVIQSNVTVVNSVLVPRRAKITRSAPLAAVRPRRVVVTVQQVNLTTNLVISRPRRVM